MRPALIGSAVWLLLQSPLLVNIGAVARPEYMPWQRAVELPPGRSGMTCATLDATVLSHTGSPAHYDLRLFHSMGGGGLAAEAEVPYTLTESGPEPVADTAATAENVVIQGSQLRFDLRMPARPYSEVQLALPLRDFVATATAQGVDRHGRTTDLGRVALFDLSARGLGRWTTLLLAETSSPVLRLTLDLRTPDGRPLQGLPPVLAVGAVVPPSRARQTRYVPTVSTDQLHTDGALSVATLQAPTHVPIERVLFQFSPGLQENFAREVAVSARTRGAPLTDTEALDAGTLESVSMPSGDPRLYPIDLHEDALNATLGATLAGPASVLVAIYNNGQPPLPVRAVVLEMRERRLCFFADREGAYTLRYGDPTLPAPTYDESALAVPVDPLNATLAPQTRNPHFRPRREARSALARYPELYWVAVLLCAGMMGGTALHHVQHRRA